jgi:hypothetical protein
MPRIIQTTVYKYEELNEKAQAKARDWYRNVSAGDNYFADCLTGPGCDFENVARFCGWQIGQRKHGKNGELAIYWSGFWSQGDGLHFVGKWHAAHVDLTALKAWAPEDKELHALGERFAKLAHDHRFGVGNISDHNSRYVHAMTVTPIIYVENGKEPTPADEDEFRDVSRGLMRWMYRALEKQYEYENSDEAVADTIKANEYEFTEEGKRL